MTRRTTTITTLLLLVALMTSAAAPLQLMAAPPSPAAGAAPMPASRTQIYIGQGFDTCEIPSFDALQEWITHSPYEAVNLYIGGVARACSNRALTAPFLTRLAGIGWKFIPTWVGPQAPCYNPNPPNNKPRMSPDPALSYDQGVAEADAAVGVATGLGLAEADGSGTIIYYDMEYYDTGKADCNAAVGSFISGWTARLRSRGNLAAVYGTVSALTSFANIGNVPDAAWPARWLHTAYTSTVTVWDIPNLSNTLWGNHQRIWQYAGGHNEAWNLIGSESWEHTADQNSDTSHPETWGSVTLNIDCDVIDGIVASIPPPELPFKAYLPAILNGVASP
jgi:hypothetical protein